MTSESLEAFRYVRQQIQVSGDQYVRFVYRGEMDLDREPQTFAEIPIFKGDKKAATFKVYLPELTKENSEEGMQILLHTLDEMEAEVLHYQDVARRALETGSTLRPSRARSP